MMSTIQIDDLNGMDWKHKCQGLNTYIISIRRFCFLFGTFMKEAKCAGNQKEKLMCVRHGGIVNNQVLHYYALLVHLFEIETRNKNDWHNPGNITQYCSVNENYVEISNGRI